MALDKAKKRQSGSFSWRVVRIVLLLQAFFLPLASREGDKMEDEPNVQHYTRQTVVFWNMENAFWPDDDPEKLDDDFTPEGMRHWTFSRLRQKLTLIERGLLAAGGGLPPMVVGLAEVEGDSVMNYWLKRTSLRRFNYSYILSDSADSRGIRTALMYQAVDFRLLHSESFSIPLGDEHRSTRQLLHACGRLANSDTLDLIICHLPSQYGGAKQSEEARKSAQRRLMQVADSIASCRVRANVILMGDMNEAPSARRQWWGKGWDNLMLPLQRELQRHPDRYGSHKYQGEWSFLDQFIVRTMNDETIKDEVINDEGMKDEGINDEGMKDEAMRESARLWVENARSFSIPAMLTDDESHLGKRPLRSYYGSQYEGGVSDHLPIVLDLYEYMKW